MKFILVIGNGRRAADAYDVNHKYPRHFETLHELKSIGEIRQEIEEKLVFKEFVFSSCTILTEEEAMLLTPKSAQMIIDSKINEGTYDGFVEIKE